MASPQSSACRDRIHDGCTGFTDGYETYHCGCRCHWCASCGYFLPDHEPGCEEGAP